jgi:hypothetical protein
MVMGWVEGWSPTNSYDAKLEYKETGEVPRWKFELDRFGAWFVFQVSFFVTLVIPPHIEEVD